MNYLTRHGPSRLVVGDHSPPTPCSCVHSYTRKGSNGGRGVVGSGNSSRGDRSSWLFFLRAQPTQIPQSTTAAGIVGNAAAVL